MSESPSVYVGNLPFGATEDDLRELFQAHGGGQIHSAKVITDRETGKSKGFGFVELGSIDEAYQAIEQLKSVEFQGRAIRVSMAKPRN